ncbi:phage protease [uncultured Methylobacterium sp.]|uniref:phage protease n=1 Tax=uncultured Methylobacterium sp. TaxID=157278 RepID=UPI0035CB30AE
MSQPIRTAEPATVSPAASSPAFAVLLRGTLGLPATADEAAVHAAVDALQAGATETPDGYVTRETHEAVCREFAATEAAMSARLEAVYVAMLAGMVTNHHCDLSRHIAAAAVADPLLPADVRLAGLALALNSRDPLTSGDCATATATGLALNVEGGTGAPEWVQLLPAGPLLAGRDGRRFTIADPAAVVAATEAHGLPLVVDFEHASEIGDKGVGGAPAAGWIEELAVRAGQIWGRVVWTARAGTAIAAREYRFLSPVFNHTRDTAQNVVALLSAGLVHRPNLDLKALNARQGLSLLASLCKILGLPETASESEALTAAQALKDASGRAANAAEVPLDRYVGRTIHEETVQALNAATAQLAARDADATKARAERLVDDAVAGGKVTPATRGHYVTMALNTFDTTAALIGALPVIVSGGESETAQRAGRELGRAGATGLNDQQRAICANLGLDEAEYAASLAAEARAVPRPRA